MKRAKRGGVRSGENEKKGKSLSVKGNERKFVTAGERQTDREGHTYQQEKGSYIYVKKKGGRHRVAHVQVGRK